MVLRLNACALGPLAYRDGLRLQESLVRACADGETGDWLLFPEHPPVLTLGRQTAPDSLRASPEALDRMGIERFEVARGGDVTWHGPGQLVGYTIFNLARRDRDLHRLLRALETGLIDLLAGYGVAADRVNGRTGVWVGEAKIASIGIAVRRWVSYHGFALNVCPDLSFFDLIHPCGLHGIHMTSVADRLGPSAPKFEEIRVRAGERMAELFQYQELRWADPAEVWQVAGEVPAAAPESRPTAAA